MNVYRFRCGCGGHGDAILPDDIHPGPGETVTVTRNAFCKSCYQNIGSAGRVVRGGENWQQVPKGPLSLGDVVPTNDKLADHLTALEMCGHLKMASSSNRIADSIRAFFKPSPPPPGPLVEICSRTDEPTTKCSSHNLVCSYPSCIKQEK